MKKNSKEKTKKEHYVPRCYLKRWANNNRQVNVYDKYQKKARVNNVYDVACEKFYYDIDYRELSHDKVEFLKSFGINPEKDGQFIEHFFADYIETAYSEVLTRIVDKEITPWHEKNCYFIKDEDRYELALCVAFQNIRTKATRNVIAASSNCLEQVLREMACSEEIIERYTINQQQEQIVQGNMLLDIEKILELTKCFCDLIWILGVNRTGMPFYTSDNPIGTYAHIKHPILSMAGIRSKGVEVFFPLSPNLILLMFDGNYHKEKAYYDGRYMSLDDVNTINRYNRLCV